MLLLLAEPNVLLLDEPTNDLDIETLTELEDLLDGWPGSVVVVSHDRYFLERVTDRTLALTGGGLKFLPGGVEEYLAIREREAVQQAARATASSQPSSVRPSAPERERPKPGVSAAAQRAGQKELTRLERQIARLTDEEAKLAEQLAASATDYERLVELGADLQKVQLDRADLEERWLAVAEQIGG